MHVQLEVRGVLKLGIFLSRFQPYFLRQSPSLNLGLTEELH